MAEYMLETKNLGISFGGLKAAQDVNIRIKKNQLYGLIGPNGAGKTTIFNLISKIYESDEGRIEFDGQDITKKSQIATARMGMGCRNENI